MKIVICASIDFSYEIKEIANKLKESGHEVLLPFTAEKILEGKINIESIKKEKETNTNINRMIKQDLIRNHYKKIKDSDAILVLNFDKGEIKNYIGGNVFLEIGFAHILNKKIFILNNLPNLPYSNEILSMQPTILNGDLTKIGD